MSTIDWLEPNEEPPIIRPLTTMTALVPVGHFPFRYTDFMRDRAVDTLASAEELAAPELLSLPFDDTYHVYCGEVKGGVCDGGVCGSCGFCDGGISGLAGFSGVAGISSCFEKRPDKSIREQADILAKKTRTTHIRNGKKNGLLFILLNLTVAD
jgi:hypothetical protein